MKNRKLGYPTFDADNHMYETEDALTRFLPRAYKGAVEYLYDKRGRARLVVKGVVSHMIPNPTFERVARPGTAEQYFMGNNPDGLTFREFIGESMGCIPAFQEPAPRIELMDEQGIDQTIMYPTLASLIEERTRDDVELTMVIMHALNEWLADQWSFDYEGRIYATPMVSLAVVDRAIEELEWAVERGARTVLIRPAPVPTIKGGSRSMGLPEFDPFWARCVELGLPVTFHASDSGYQRHLAEWEGGDEYLSFKESALREVVVGHRAIEDTMGAMVCHGAFTRHPELKVLVVENGSSFVEPLLEALDRAYGIMPQEFDENPVEAFKRNAYVHPFLEDDVLGTIDTLGVEHVLFGSDFPHPEGIGEPLSFIDKLEGLGDAEKQLVMGGNLSRVMGTPVPA